MNLFARFFSNDQPGKGNSIQASELHVAYSDYFAEMIEEEDVSSVPNFSDGSKALLPSEYQKLMDVMCWLRVSTLTALRNRTPPTSVKVIL